MKYDLKNNKYFRWGVTAFLTIAASICFYYLLFHGSSIKTGFHTIIGILMPVVFGLVTAYLLTPVLNFIETNAISFVPENEGEGEQEAQFHCPWYWHTDHGIFVRHPDL